MIFIRLRFREGTYGLAESHDKKLNKLAFFFTDDVRSHVASFKSWLLNPLLDYTASNYSFLEKEGDTVIIGDQYAVGDPYEYCLELPISDLIQLLDQWDTLYKRKPKEIIIKCENGKIVLEGID